MKMPILHASPTPVYIQIKDHLNEYIKSNGLIEGEALPTLSLIAKWAGVSLKTAERGLNELIKDGVCFRRPKKGTFVGAPLKAISKGVCGVFHSGGLQSMHENIIQQKIYDGISSKSSSYGKDIIFMTGDADEKLSFYNSQPNIDITGILMIHWEGYNDGLELALRFPDTKFIFLQYDIKGIEDTPDNVFGVYNDDFSGAYQMTDFFIRKTEAKKIAILGVDIFAENYRNRISGYSQALDDNDISFDANLIKLQLEHKDGNHAQLAKDMTKELLDANDDLDTLICLHDKLAEGAYDYLKTKGLEKQIKVSGFDNISPEITRELNINTVSIDFKGMGEKAVDVLFQKKAYCPKITRLMPQLLIRNALNPSIKLEKTI